MYRFLARRTRSDFAQIVLKRLFMSKIHKPPISLGKIISYRRRTREEKGRRDAIYCIVGTVTDDVRIMNIPKLTVSIYNFYRFLFLYPFGVFI